MSQATSHDLVVPMPRGRSEEGVVVAGATAASAVPVALDSAGRLRRSAREWYLPFELGLGLALALTVVVVREVPTIFSIVVVSMALVVNYHAGRETMRPGLPHIGRIVKDQGVPVVAVAAGVTVGVLHEARLIDAFLLVSMIASVAIAGTATRRVFRGQVRLMVVGSPADIAKSATRWAGDRRAKVVGALVLGEGDEPVIEFDSWGVPTATGLDDVADWATAWKVDMAVVMPSPAISQDVVRRLAWDLEDSPASIAVMGVLDSVAPHRIETARLADATLLHVRSSRPSPFVRFVKAGVDRVGGVALLVVAAPILLAMMALVRLDSAGPAVFKQTRVGLRGKTFTMYKMRTMRVDAEQVKAELTELNEGNGVLFKMHNDPRVTRVGRILRKTSLDELPQLINVVFGQMSLVGPRPALPDEVARYSPEERRRLAVRPGMTGLWQVSGRSNLSWERSVELDLRYVDNWRLVDDLGIGARTAGAVVRSRGAY